jgi:transposase InsO family protein
MIINRKKGHYYNDAAMESWNRSLKVEAIQGVKFLSRAEAKQLVIEYFEAYYNRTRLHSKLGYLSPETFEAKRVSLQ